MLTCQDHRRINSAWVASFRIAPLSADQPRSLLIEDISLVPGVSYIKLSMPSDNLRSKDWPGKLKKAADLERHRVQEDADLREHPVLPDRDEYGGWASGPQLVATGYFRTARYKYRWWLVSPSGHLFFSLGMERCKRARSTNRG